MSHDPVRWLSPDSEASEALRAALRDLRNEPVDAQALAALTERLTGTTGGVKKPPGRVGTGVGWLKLALMAVTAVTLAPAEPMLQRATLRIEPVSAPAQAAYEHASAAASDQATAQHQRSVTGKPAASAPTVPHPVTQPPAPAGRPQRPKSVSRSSLRPRRPKRASAPSAPDPTQAELHLLTRAQAALHTRPEHALALADEHARRYPRGVFVQEREVIAIDALLKLSRDQQARERAQALLRAYPGSPHAQRADELLRTAHGKP